MDQRVFNYRLSGNNIKGLVMSEKKILTQDEVRKLFDYNPDTGFLTRKVKLNNRNSIGENVGSLTCRG